MRKVFLGTLTLLFAFILVTGCSCNKKDTKKNNDVLDNESNVVVKDKKVNELDIIDFLVVYENDFSDIYFTIQNNTNEAVTYNEIECSMYNKNKELLFTFSKEVGPIESMDEKDISFSVNLDLTKVSNVEYVLK